MASTYGPIITGTDIEEAVRATLQRWLDTMLGEVERQSGTRWDLREVQRPRTWHMVTDYRASSADRKLPCVAIEIAPTARSYTGDGLVNKEAGLNLIVIAKGQDREKTRDTLSALVTGIEMVLEKHGDMDGFAAWTVVGDIEPDVIPAEKAKTVAGARIPIVVGVNATMSKRGGPAEPDPPEEDLPAESPEDPDHLSTHVNVRHLDQPAPDPPSGDRAGANVSIVFSSATAALGESGTYRVRTATRVVRFTVDCVVGPIGSALTLQLLVNGTLLGEVSIADGSTVARVLDLSHAVAVGDLISVEATETGVTPAEGVTAQIDLASS